MTIKNKIILITGASSGIGEAAARLLTKRGAKVVLAARSQEKLEALSKELPGSFVVPVDMTKADSIKKMIAETKAHFGQIDVLVNNAGRGTGWQNIEVIDVDAFRDLMELNVYGPIIAMQEVIPIMRAQGGGAIINIGSGTVKMMREGASVYPGTKVLLQHISRVARLELAKDSISVTILHPYITKTDFFKNIMKQNPKAQVASRPDFMSIGDDPERVAEKIVEAIETGVEEIDMSASKR